MFAELAVLYNATTVPRTPSDVFSRVDDGKTASASVATGKVIAAAFDKVERRDPGHERPWVVFVDGAKESCNRPGPPETRSCRYLRGEDPADRRYPATYDPQRGDRCNSAGGTTKHGSGQRTLTCRPRQSSVRSHNMTR